MSDLKEIRMIGYNIILFFALFAGSCSSSTTSGHTETGNQNNTDTTITMNAHLTTSNLVQDIVKHPAFSGFGELLLPNDDNTRYYNTAITNIGALS